MTNLTSRSSRTVLAIALGIAGTLVVSGNQVGAAEAPVGLGTAASFAVLAGSTVTNTGPSVINGDVGVSPGTAVVGFPPGTVTNGTIHAADAVAAQAQADLTTAYNDAAGRSPTASVSADLAGQTLVPGVYRGATLGLTGTVTLDAQGDSGAVFIFQAGSTLTTASASEVLLINGANACNVYWQVGSSATLGTNTSFRGTILALTSITANTGASVEGRLLARNGAVTLDTNSVNRGNCSAAGGGATTTTTTATTTTTTTTVPATTTTTVPATTTTTVPVTTTTTVPATTATTVPATTTTTVPVTTTTTVPATTATTVPTGTSVTGTIGGSGTPLGAPITSSSIGRGTPRQASGGPQAGGGQDTSRVTRSTPPLARTGSQLSVTALAGLLALVLGAMMLAASGPTPRAAGGRRRRG